MVTLKKSLNIRRFFCHQHVRPSLPMWIVATVAFTVLCSSCSATGSYECVLLNDPELKNAIVGGTEQSSYLKLESAERTAVVRIEYLFETSPYYDACSGVVLSQDWILSAAHCTHSLTPIETRISVVAADTGQIVHTTPQKIIAHPNLDLMLISVEGALNNLGFEISPVVLYNEPMSKRELVEIAGFGIDERQQSGHRLFSVAEIEDIDPSTIQVFGWGISGACFGDSGGPLLVRDARGDVAVAGILTEGSKNCAGLDRYTRIDIADSWITTECQLGLVKSISTQCTTIDTKGRCYGNTAVWCDADHTRQVETCREDKHCGWHSDKQGYRCVPAEDDPCDGISDVGICEETESVRCDDGRLVTDPCDLCDATCLRMPHTGMTACAHQ